MSSAARYARHMAKPGNRAKHNARTRVAAARKRAAAAEEAQALEYATGVLEYRRGFIHGVQAARAIVAHYNGGRSWTSQEIERELDEILTDAPTAICVVGDFLVENDLPVTADVLGAFWDRQEHHVKNRSNA